MLYSFRLFIDERQMIERRSFVTVLGNGRLLLWLKYHHHYLSLFQTILGSTSGLTSSWIPVLYLQRLPSWPPKPWYCNSSSKASCSCLVKYLEPSFCQLFLQFYFSFSIFKTDNKYCEDMNQYLSIKRGFKVVLRCD